MNRRKNTLQVCKQSLTFLNSCNLLVFIFAWSLSSALAYGAEELSPSGEDSEHPAAQAAIALNRAIAEGDITSLKSILDPHVLIFESGNVESSLAEYESHHMKSDIAFMKAMQSELISRQVIDAGDAAIVASRSRLTGTYKGNKIDLVNTETLVFENRDGRWKVVHIHWSSN